MGDNTPSVGDQTKQIFGSLIQNAPAAISAINNTLGGTAQSQLAAQQAVEPGYESLYNQNQQATAATQAGVVAGPAGQSLVSSADKYQQQLDPQYYAQRNAISDALTKYLSSYSPTQLTPTENAEIARGINATTGPITPSAQNTIKNAQTFGAAGTQRWQNFGNAITQAANALPQLRSGISGFNVASSTGSNPGAANATQNALGSNYGFSSTALGNISGAANAVLQKTMTPWQQALAGSQVLGNVVGAAKNASAIG